MTFDPTPGRLSRRDETVDDESLCRMPNSPLAEANGTNFGPDNLVDSGSIGNLTPSGSDCSHILDSSDLSRRGLGKKLLSRLYAFKCDGKLNTLIS